MHLLLWTGTKKELRQEPQLSAVQAPLSSLPPTATCGEDPLLNMCSCRWQLAMEKDVWTLQCSDASKQAIQRDFSGWNTHPVKLTWAWLPMGVHQEERKPSEQGHVDSWKETQHSQDHWRYSQTSLTGASSNPPPKNQAPECTKGTAEPGEHATVLDHLQTHLYNFIALKKHHSVWVRRRSQALPCIWLAFQELLKQEGRVFLLLWIDTQSGALAANRSL